MQYREADEDANNGDLNSTGPGAQPKEAVNNQVYPKSLTRVQC